MGLPLLAAGECFRIYPPVTNYSGNFTDASFGKNPNALQGSTQVSNKTRVEQQQSATVQRRTRTRTKWGVFVEFGRWEDQSYAVLRIIKDVILQCSKLGSILSGGSLICQRHPCLANHDLDIFFKNHGF